MKDYSKMTDQELNEAAARAMGWDVQRIEGARYAVVNTGVPYDLDFPRKDYRIIWDHQMQSGDTQGFHPAVDLNHAAEFMAFVSGLFPSYRWALYQACDNSGVWGAALFDVATPYLERVSATATRLSRAETIACLMACDVVKKGNEDEKVSNNQ